MTRSAALVTGTPACTPSKTPRSPAWATAWAKLPRVDHVAAALLAAGELRLGTPLDPSERAVQREGQPGLSSCAPEQV